MESECKIHSWWTNVCIHQYSDNKDNEGKVSALMGTEMETEQRDDAMAKRNHKQES